MEGDGLGKIQLNFWTFGVNIVIRIERHIGRWLESTFPTANDWVCEDATSHISGILFQPCSHWTPFWTSSFTLF